jgi:hypothetical protein
MIQLVLVLLFSLGLAKPASAQRSSDLLLFGGPGHKTFLGCLNCGSFDSGSVCNKFGDHGSKFSTESIWNKYGEFGSKYSNTSPWNKYASDPPAIVDKDGNFYGYLTANRYNSKRTQIEVLVTLTDLADQVTDDPMAVADRFCGRG